MQPKNSSRAIGALLTLGWLWLAAFSTGAAAQEPFERAVVIGGSLTEIAYELGVEDRIIAVDTTSVWPPEALQDKPDVGYMRALSPEGVLALDPDLVLALSGAGPPTTFDILEQAGATIVTVPEGYTPAAIAEKIRIVAEVFGEEEAGAALAERVTTEIAEVETALEAVTEPKSVLFVFSFASGRIVAAGQETGADAIITLAGGVNAMTGFTGYVPVSDEAVTAAAPDIVLAMQNAGPEDVTDAVFELPALSQTPAGETQSFISFDGQYMLAFGPRTASAIRDVALALYPELAPVLLPETESVAE